MFDPQKLITALHHHKVRYVIIGGVAAEIHGAEQKTGDFDICYDRAIDNIAALVSAISPLAPRLRGKNIPENLPFHFDVETVKRGFNFTLHTSVGDLDLLGIVDGVGEYKQALATSEEVSLYGKLCRVLSIDALIASKKAADRPKDRAVILELEAIKVLKKNSGR